MLGLPTAVIARQVQPALPYDALQLKEEDAAPAARDENAAANEVVITGAGMAIFNGTYRRNGKHNGKHRYRTLPFLSYLGLSYPW